MAVAMTVAMRSFSVVLWAPSYAKLRRLGSANRPTRRLRRRCGGIAPGKEHFDVSCREKKMLEG
jgi:hypothetical protein